MEDHRFGNLRDWGSVLEKLEKVKESKDLDAYQDELIRILRYKENWRLTERVLECAREICQPKDELIGEICGILCNLNRYADSRVLAARALSAMIPKNVKGTAGPSKSEGSSAVEIMKALLQSPDVPLVHDAISKALQCVGG